MALKLEAVVSPAAGSSSKDRIPVIKSLAVSNDTDEAVDNVKIVILPEPQFAKAKAINVKHIGPNEKIKIKNADIAMIPEYFSKLKRRTDGSILITAEIGGKRVTESIHSIAMLQDDEWFGIGLPDAVASFITPKDPKILRIASNTAKLLGTWTGDATLDRYASADRSVTRKEISAVYAAIQQFGVRVTSNKGIIRAGGRITPAGTIIDRGSGSSFDLSLLFVSCAEAIGLNAVLIFTEDRTTAGVWTDDVSFRESVQSDPAVLTRAIRDGSLTVIDCDGVSMNKKMDIDASESSAKRIMADESGFLLAVDVRCLRGDPVIAAKKQKKSVNIVSPADENEDVKGLARMKQWEDLLLDLSYDNELLSMKMNDTVLPIMTNNLSTFRNALISGDEFSIRGRPDEWDDRIMNESPFELSSYMGRHQVLIEQDLKNGTLRTPFSEKEVKRRISEMHRMSKEHEDNCKNELFIVIGIMKWADDRGRTIYAPIAMMPAETSVRSVNDEIRIRMRSDETRINRTLLEKLRAEHNIDLSLDPLPGDKSGASVRMIYEAVENAIRSKDGWKIVDGVLMGIFKPERYELWNDLRGRSDRVFSNELTKSLMEGKLLWDPLKIDDNDLYKRPMMPFELDDSQMKAVKASTGDRTFVMHAPSGTGRTQAIAGMVADAVYNKKTILVVSEKNASLSSVKRRLDDTAIGKFCLHLNSGNASKRDLLDHFRSVLDSAEKTFVDDYGPMADGVERIYNELSEPLRAMGRKRNCGMSIYELIAMYDTFDRSKARVIDLPVDLVRSVTPSSTEKWESLVKELISAAKALGHPAEHPLADVGLSEFDSGTVGEITKALNEWIDTAEKTESASNALTSAIATEEGILNDDADAEGLADLLASMDELPCDAVNSESISATNEKIHELAKAARQSFEIVNNAAGTFDTVPRDDIVEILKKYQNRVRDAADLLNNVNMNVNTELLYGYIKKMDEVSEKIRSTYRMLKEVRTEWNDSILTTNTKCLMDNWNDANKKLFSGGAKKAIVNTVSKHLKNDILKFERLPDMISPVEAYVSQINEIKEMLREMDVINGGEFAGLMDDCRMLESIHERISEKIELLSVHGNADMICGMFAKDPNVKEYTSSYVSLISELAEKRNVVKRITDTDISKAAVTDDIKGWKHLRDKWLKNSDQFEKIAEWNRCKDVLAREGLKCIPDAYMEGLDHDIVLLSFRTSLCIYLIDTYTLSETCLVQFDSSSYESKASKFRAIMRKFIHLCRKEMSAEASSRIPDVTSSELADMKALQQAIVNRGKGATIRSILDSMKGIMREVCPCMLMGPSSVPFYLGDDLSFDIVVIADASLIPVHKAVGLITRGESTVIIGDKEHTHPLMIGNHSESLLDAVNSLPLPRCDLKWLYIDESLAEFSNSKFYGRSMNTFPAVNKNITRLKSIIVNDRRGTPEEAEAEAIVKRVMVRMREKADKRKSTGVVAFSGTQKRSIEERIKSELMKYPKLEEALYSVADPFFIKLAEDALRHERDSIIISLGISKDENGNLSGLGPFAGMHGELMLNSAISSSRKEVAVFTSLSSGDIPNDGPAGVKILKELLEYTENGLPHVEKRTDGSCDAIAKAIEEKGFTVHKNVGSSNATIDIGIVDPNDPNRYILGILLDGSEFSGPNGMDANFGFMNIFDGLGWNIRRLWAVDWLNDRDAEIEKIVNSVNDILSGDKTAKNTDVSILDIMMMESAVPAKRSTDPGHRVKQLYTKANLMEKTVSMEALFSNSSRNMVERDVMKIIESESPIAIETVAERLFGAYGIKEITPALLNRMMSIIDMMEIGSIKTPWNVKILWDNVRGSAAYITYRVPPKGEKRDMRFISPKELINATMEIVLERPGLNADELITELAEVFGNEEITEDDRDIAAICISMAVGDGLIKRDSDERIFLRSD
ncbi:MAG: DUF4011 domain-containing protein [Methanomassiliicoccaceae archaeon]|nr:DUF4011 domain-containing protein [Methanomassiliicoccaceae archaeon]